MILTEIVSSLLEFITFYIIVHFFIDSSFVPTKKDVIACFIAILFSLIGHDFFIFSWIFGQGFYLIYIISFKKQKIVDRLLLFCLTYATVAICQFVIIFSLSFCHISFNDEYIPTIGSLLTITLTTLLFLATPYRKLYSFISATAFIYKMLLINSYLIVAAAMLYMKISSFHFYKNITYFITITALIIAFNACILYYDQKLSTEHQQLVSYQKNLPIYKSLIDEIRASQHEFSNRIQNLEQLPYVCKDYESICNALLKSTNSFKHPLRAYSLLQLNMPLLSATLYNLYTQANKQNITILFDISSSYIESNAPEYILADFISILTNNAIEACHSDDKIYIRITSTNQRLHFEIRNPFNQLLSTATLSQFFQKGFSTKHKQNDNAERGFGLCHLANEIRVYNGSVGVDCIEYQNCYWIIFELDV